MGLGIGAGSVYLKDKTAFPVASENCDRVNGTCFTGAKFKDWLSCQWSNELGNMRCDRTDPNNVVCKPAPDALVFGQCVNR
jgi:hypothetical protein